MKSFSLTANFCNVIRHTFTLKGRATRRELWGFFAFPWIIWLLWSYCAACIGSGLSDPEGEMPDWFSATSMAVQCLYLLGLAALFTPFCTLCVRRLHDVGMSGKWLFCYLPLGLPLVLPMLSLVLCGPDAPFGPLFVFFALAVGVSQLLGMSPESSLFMLGGWLMGWGLIILSYTIFLLIQFLRAGTPGANRYGQPQTFTLKQIS